MRRQFTLLFLVALTAAAVGCGKSDSSALKSDNKIGYVKLLRMLGTESVRDRSVPKTKMDHVQALAGMQNAILDLESLKIDDPDLVRIRDLAYQGIRNALDAVRKLEHIPKPAGFVESFMTGFAYGAIFRPDLAVDFDNKNKGYSEAIQTEVNRFIDGAHQTESAAVLLSRVMKKYSGPSVTSKEVVEIDIDETIITGPDWLTLTNSSGQNLTNVGIGVRLVGKDGDVKNNVHCIPTWKAGQTVHFRYETGIAIGDKRISCQTVRSIHTAVIDIASDELYRTNITYPYIGPERDKDLQHHLNEITNLYVTFHPYKKGLVWDDTCTVRVSFKGQSALPGGRVTVRLRNARQQQAYYLSYSRWNEGAEKSIEFPDVTWSTTEYDITISIDDSTASRTWTSRP